MSRYASQTDVSADRSKAEIERTLQRYGATQFAYGWQGSQAVIGFQMSGQAIRFLLPLPPRGAMAFTHTPTRNKTRSPAAAEAAWEQACRQRWRALALAIKAKLEAVSVGIVTFEDEFLAQTVLPGGSTVGDWARGQLKESYATGRMPPLLPAPKETR